MTTKINLYAGPAAGFDQPFEMLLACHERIERMLCLLEKLAIRLTVSGLDQDCKDAVTDVMRYFDLAGPAHHQDEELHVLPLLKSGAIDEQQLAMRIEQEHRLMAQQWEVLRQDLGMLCTTDEGALGNLSLSQGWQQRWAGFAQLHREHIGLEESKIFIKARERLDAASIETMSLEMARRRQAPAT